MKIFLSYSAGDEAAVKPLKDYLVQQNHRILDPRTRHDSNQSIFKIIEDEMLEADLLVSVWGRNSRRSKNHLRELSAMKILADTNQDVNLLVLVLGNGNITPELKNYNAIVVRDWEKTGFKNVDYQISTLSRESVKEWRKKSEEKSERYDTEKLTKALEDGKLTLVCGAGISIGAKIPTWTTLLDRLLDAMVDRLTSNSKGANAARSELRDIRDSSSLIAGRYLKNVFKDDFAQEVRDALYQDVVGTCDAIDAIVDLSRPQRSRSPLDSIISFNFDDLLERNFEKAAIDYKAVFSEGMRNDSNEIPIFHVHGYLPRRGKLGRDVDIVFSEDAYHDQFVDPFSWSNLTQLNKFTQNTCLFVGLSMTDPNLRRLLDVANRRDSKNSKRHCVILKREEDSSRNRMMESLKEEDAASLGLSIIWVDSFDDIPKLIRMIG